MSSELEVLKQRIIELEAKNAKIPDLRRKISEFDAERVELKRKIAEILRMTEEEKIRHNADNVKLKAENVKFRDRFTKVEQKQILQSALIANAVLEAITVLINSAKCLNGKLLKKKEMDNFLLEAHKKIVSSEIK